MVRMSNIFKSKLKLNKKYEIDLFGTLYLKEYLSDFNFLKSQLLYFFFNNFFLSEYNILYIKYLFLKRKSVHSFKILNWIFLILENRQITRNWWWKQNKKFKKKKVNISELHSLLHYIERKRTRSKSFFGKYLLNKQLFKLNYINLKEFHFKKYIKYLHLLKGNIWNNFAFLFERRLDALLLRSIFLLTPAVLKQLINHGQVFVNFQKIFSSNYKLNIGDIVSINKRYAYLVLLNLEKSLYFHEVYKLYPYYMEIDLRLVFLTLIKRPFFKELAFITKLNYSLLI